MTPLAAADIPVRPAMLGYAAGCLVCGLVALGGLAASTLRPVVSTAVTLVLAVFLGVVLALLGRGDRRHRLDDTARVPMPDGPRDRVASWRGVTASLTLSLAYALLLGVGNLLLDLGSSFSAPATVLLTFGVGYLLQARDLGVQEDTRQVVAHLAAGLSWWQRLRFLDPRHWVLVEASAGGRAAPRSS